MVLTNLPVRWSSGPLCPPWGSASPWAAVPFGTEGIFLFSCGKCVFFQFFCLFVFLFSISGLVVNNKSKMFPLRQYAEWLRTQALVLICCLTSRKLPSLHSFTAISVAERIKRGDGHLFFIFSTNIYWVPSVCHLLWMLEMQKWARKSIPLVETNN